MYELRLIEMYYGNKSAKRSGVPYINHIYEGIKILEHIIVTENTIKAYCLHPIFQMDKDLISNLTLISKQDPYVMSLVMEYRNQANAWLSDKIQNGVITDKPSCGPFAEVKWMLIADKVQNYKDFEMYHAKTHQRSKDLYLYFNEWCKHLNIDYSELKKLIS